MLFGCTLVQSSAVRHQIIVKIEQSDKDNENDPNYGSEHRFSAGEK